MPITICENAGLQIHAIDIAGRVTTAELCELATVHEERRDWAALDTVRIIHPGAAFDDVCKGDFDTLKERYRRLQEGFELHLLRRVAWLCLEPRAATLVEYLTTGRRGEGAQLSFACDYAGLGDLFDEGRLKRSAPAKAFGGCAPSTPLIPRNRMAFYPLSTHAFGMERAPSRRIERDRRPAIA